MNHPDQEQAGDVSASTLLFVAFLVAAAFVIAFALFVAWALGTVSPFEDPGGFSALFAVPATLLSGLAMLAGFGALAFQLSELRLQRKELKLAVRQFKNMALTSGESLKLEQLKHDPRFEFDLRAVGADQASPNPQPGEPGFFGFGAELLSEWETPVEVTLVFRNVSQQTAFDVSQVGPVPQNEPQTRLLVKQRGVRRVHPGESYEMRMFVDHSWAVWTEEEANGYGWQRPSLEHLRKWGRSSLPLLAILVRMERWGAEITFSHPLSLETILDLGILESNAMLPEELWKREAQGGDRTLLPHPDQSLRIPAP